MPPPRPPVHRGEIDVGGRRVGYRWFGVGPEGRTVVYCHGGLSCAADAAPSHQPALERGLGVLALDRPGLGRSAPTDGRDTAWWGDLAAGALDALHVEASGVVGWSLGGQYALALARADRRVRAVAVLAGVPPLDRPGIRAGLHPTDRLLLRAAALPGPVARTTFSLTGRLAVRAARRRGTGPSGPQPTRRDLRTWGTADAAALRGPDGPALLAATTEATAARDAMVEEYRAWHRPWGFEPSEVEVPVTVWHGTEDRWVSAAAVDRLVGELPTATRRERAGEGHLLPLTAWADVLDDLDRACG